MRSRIAATVVMASLLAAPVLAQKKSPPKGVSYDLTVNTDGQAHTGTMTLAIAGGKVSGDMHITAPGEITGKPAGTVKAQVMKLDFAYRMVQRACDGRIVMELKMPAKKDAGPATGTAEITGCGRTDAQKLSATVELRAKK